MSLLSLPLALSAFTWVVGGVPRSADGCAAAARALGQRFAAATGAEVSGTACAGEGTEGDRLSVTYLADRAAAVVPAVFGFFWTPDRTAPGDPLASGPLWGAFDDYAACAAAGAGEATRFQRETGLAPVAVSCARASVGGYALRIDGFGAAPRRFAQIAAEFPADADAGLAAAVAGLIAGGAGGPTIVDARPWGPNVLVSFYGDPGAGVLVKVPGYTGELPDRAACEAELAWAKAALVAAGAPALGLGVCLDAAERGGARMALVFTGLDGAAPYVERRAGAFATHGACAAGRAAAAATLQAATDRRVGGVVCVRGADGAFAAVGIAR